MVKNHVENELFYEDDLCDEEVDENNGEEQDSANDARSID